MGQLTRRVGRLRKIEVAYILICLCLESITDVSFAAKNNAGIVLKNGQNSSEKKKNTSEGYDLKVSSDTNALNRKSRQTPVISSEEGDLFESGMEFSPDLMPFNVLPNSRPGRSEEGKRIKQSSLIPFPRFGRKTAFDPNLIMPYPDSWIEPYLQKSLYNSAELFSDNDTHFEDMPMNYEYMSEDSKEDIDEDEKPSAFEDSTQSAEESEKNIQSAYDLVKLLKKRQSDNNGTIIPYPRLGREEEGEFQNNEYENRHYLVRRKRSSDYIIPQIRYGRSSLSAKATKPPKQPYYILPNFRPGRSSRIPVKLLKIDVASNQRLLPYPRPGRAENSRQGYIVPLPRFGRTTEEKTTMEILSQYNPSIPQELRNAVKKSSESFVIPYPRAGKRFFGTKPLPPNVILESKDKDQSAVLENKEREPAVVTFVLPYPRPGRSDSKNNGNNYLIPYARPGRVASNSLLPYPRLGRSSNTGNQYYILPYPRAGRSQKSDFLLPYPRLGRSTQLDENYNSRLKKYSTNTILPYPRMGRSENKYHPQSRLSNTNKSIYVLPYPRLGRATSSSYLIPQLRVGKSARSTSQEEYTRSYYDETKQKRENGFPESEVRNENEADETNYEDNIYRHISEVLNKNKLKSAALVPAKKLHKHMLTGESPYMLPYPRPGRNV